MNAALAAIVARHHLRARAEDVRVLGGSNQVVAIGGGLIVKIFAPHMRFQWEAERRALPIVHGRLSVATPALVHEGVLDDAAYLVITELAGRSLDDVWPRLDEAARLATLARIGALIGEVQAIDPGPLAAYATPWPEFLAAQRAGVVARQRARGLPPALVDELDAFLDRTPLPFDAPPVLLTGEYTPPNLLCDARGGLVGMIDLGDARVGAAEYDLLGPLTFLCAGDAARARALLDARGLAPTPAELLALLLLHRHSDLDAQVRITGWRERAITLDALASIVCGF